MWQFMNLFSRERSEFWKKRHDDNIQTTEKAKIEVDRKEHSRNENALLWMAEEVISIFATNDVGT